MTSKNSFFNKTWYKNLLQRFWILGLGIMVSYVLLYLYPMMQGANTDSYQYYATYIMGNYFIGNIMISVASLLTSIALFYYLHNRSASTIIHSLPIKRSQLYWSSFFAGITLIFLPLIITTFLMIFFGITLSSYQHLLTIRHCLSWMLMQTTLILFAYSIAQICGVITGNFYTHCILGGFFNLLPWICSQFFVMLKATFTYGIEQPEVTMGDYSTAFTYIYSLDEWLTPKTTAYLFIYIVIGIALIFISYFVYKNVRLEYIGSSVVFDKLSDIVVIIGTLVVGSFITYIFISVETSLDVMRISFVIIGIIVSFIVYCISTMIADSTIYIFNKTTFKKFGIYLIVFCLMSICFVFDIGNSESRIPKAGEISYITFYSDYTAYQDIKLNDSDSVKLLHNIHKDILKAPHYSNDYAHNFKFIYHLVDGDTLTRSYNISQTIFEKYLKKDVQALYNDSTYTNSLFKNFDWIEVSAYNYNGDSNNDFIYIDSDDYKALRYALKKDYQTVSLDSITKALNNGEYSIDITTEDQDIYSFYFNKDFKNTVTFLKLRGYAKKLFKKGTL